MIERIPAHPSGERGMPRHVAIVARGGAGASAELARRSAAVLRATVLDLADRGVAIVSVYAPEADAHLLDPLALEGEAAAFRRANVRVQTRGAAVPRDPARTAALEALCRRTAANDGLLLSVMPGYSARAEIRAAVGALARDVRDGRRPAPAPGEDALAPYLATAGLPDPDLVIATGDGTRIADFLLYQIAYAELWSASLDWDAFDAGMLDEALRSFTRRQRRFGT